MLENESIKFLKERIELINSDYPDVVDYKNALECAIRALEEVQQYRESGTPEECLRNKDFLDFLSDKMNPNDFETYLRLYNALEEKGCEEIKGRVENDAVVIAAKCTPTAYDPDKVVEQLEDYGNEETHYYKNTPYEKCIAECIGKAIEIVKAGGTDAKTDS